MRIYRYQTGKKKKANGTPVFLVLAVVAILLILADHKGKFRRIAEEVQYIC